MCRAGKSLVATPCIYENILNVCRTTQADPWEGSMNSTLWYFASLVVFATLMFVSTALAWEDRWEIKETYPGSNGRYSGSTDIEMRKKYDYDHSNKYRGTIDNYGSVRMRDYNGNTLRGNIESDGYGRLRDQDGITYRVRPR
jgi:hypothetical protein